MIKEIKYVEAKLPGMYHMYIPGKMATVCSKLPASEEDVVDFVPDADCVCEACKRRLTADFTRLKVMAG